MTHQTRTLEQTAEITARKLWHLDRDLWPAAILSALQDALTGQEGAAPSPRASTVEGIIERAEHLAETWEQGCYGDKGLRLQAEATAETLRELLELVSEPARGRSAGKFKRESFGLSEGTEPTGEGERTKP